MEYTEAQIEEIITQLMMIKIDGFPVFIVMPDEDESDRLYHSLYIDSGQTVAHVLFEKAKEQTS